MTYSLLTSQDQINAVVSQLTAKGEETMKAVGNHELSFFDGGIVEHEGIWGECLVSEMGHKSSGVINRLRDLGLWDATDQGSDDADAGMWWSLTALGADVANYLAGGLEAEPTPAEPVTEVKRGTKWTYVYVDGQLVAEIRNDQAHLLAAIV
jgi:hypothetical protein